MSTNESRRLQPTEQDLVIIQANTVDEAARILGRSRDTVRRWRKTHLPEKVVKQGRPRRALPSALVDALGKAPDAVVAREHKIPKNSVRNYRIEREIPTFSRANPRDRHPASAEAA